MAAEKISIEADATSVGITITVTLRDSEGKYIDSDTATIRGYEIADMVRDRIQDGNPRAW